MSESELMYYDDLSDYCFYLKTPVQQVKNVGWLKKNHSFTKGHVSKIFLEKIAKIIVIHSGVHVNRRRCQNSCELCGCYVPEISVNGISEWLGFSEIWIPSIRQGYFFAAPSLIYHYVMEHEYLPPKDFIEAVMQFDLNSEFNAEALYLEIIQGHF